MKRSFFALFLGLMMLSNFAFAQQTETNPTWKNKLYSQMGVDEKIRFVAVKSDEVLSLFGRTKGDQINAEGLKMIKNYLDGYVRRGSKPKFDSCSSKDWLKSDLTSILMRGGKNAAALNEEFSAQKLPPQLGIYVAMIESEFCPCLQSSTGGLGMFQWLVSSGKEYGLNIQKEATNENSDERCQPKLAARATSKYFKKMIDTIFGSDAVGFPLAIGAFNSGEGNKKRHIAEVTAISKAPRISFWVLIDTQEELIEKLDKETAEKPDGDDKKDDETSKIPGYLRQFQEENIKYVPKFFAAAIIGENPKTFGINMLPLSQIK
ncbi:MAG: transglycosylase SLT domain-containing protein [Actinomycetota bacterium]